MSKPLTLLIDPGHGGKDPGAVANCLVESEVNLAVSLLLAQVLRDQGCRVFTVRDTDKTCSLTKRVWLAEQIKPDLFVSLHCNAAEATGAQGLEVWTSPGQTPSDAAAGHILSALSCAFPGRKIRRDETDGDGDKEGRFVVLTKTVCPAVLVEMGFLTNVAEAQWIGQKLTQAQMALAIAAGILGWAVKP